MRVLKSAAAAAVIAAGFAASLPMAEAGHHVRKAVAAKAVVAKVDACPALTAIDPDADGKMTLLEALRAAKATFRKLNTDRDLTLELDEMGGRMSAKAFAAADLDKRGKLWLGEYLREVKVRFAFANPDKDRTIECDELHSKHGKLLARLLK